MENIDSKESCKNILTLGTIGVINSQNSFTILKGSDSITLDKKYRYMYGIKGEKLYVYDRIADIIHPLSEFVLLLPSFINHPNIMTASNIEDAFGSQLNSLVRGNVNIAKNNLIGALA